MPRTSAPAPGLLPATYRDYWSPRTRSGSVAGATSRSLADLPAVALTGEFLPHLIPIGLEVRLIPLVKGSCVPALLESAGTPCPDVCWRPGPVVHHAVLHVDVVKLPIRILLALAKLVWIGV